MFGKKESFNKTNHKFDVRVWLLLGFLWVLLWSLPWTTWLNTLPWLRLVLALLIFVAPGLFFSMTWSKDRFSFLGHFLIGISLSMLLVSLLGILGRITHLPFGFIKPIFFVAGLATLFTMTIQIHSGQQLFKPEHLSITTLILLIVLIVFSVFVSLWKRFRIDDFSYLAYLTNWQHASQLNFDEVFHNSGALTEIRFWLAMEPMSLALLSEISGLHGLLLIGFYLGPIFVALAILATYVLYKDLLESEQKAIVAVLIQFTLLFLLLDNKQTGTMFFLRITDDKAFASFILAPIFFLAVRAVSQTFTVQNSLLVLLTGWSLALTHPIITAFSIFIAGVYIGILTVLGEGTYRKFFVMAILFVIIILPITSTRFVEIPWVSRNIFHLDTPMKTPGRYDLDTALNSRGILTRITYLEGTSFYGFNLELIKIQIGNSSQNSPLLTFMSWACLWIMILGFLWSLFNLKKHTTAPFVMATSLLVLLCAIPYSGWLIGQFVSARMVYRAAWLLPMGLSCAVLSDGFLNFLRKKTASNNLINISDKLIFSLILGICFILICYFSVNIYAQRWAVLTKLPNYKNTLTNLSAVGDYIESELKQPALFLAPNKVRDYLPGISSKSKTLIFRGVFRSPDYPNIDESELYLVFSRKSDVTIEERKDILSKYNIQYVLIEDPLLRDYFADFPESFEIHKIKNYWIIGFWDTALH
jgi:hypothetical protein